MNTPHNVVFVDGEMVPTFDDAARAEITAKNYLPPFDAETAVEPLKLGNMVDPDKIAAKRAAHQEKILEAEAAYRAKEAGLAGKLDADWRDLVWAPETGNIVTLGIALNDHQPIAFGPRDGLDWSAASSRIHEKATLESFFKTLCDMAAYLGEFPALVGHNFRSFDLPYIVKRSIILGVRIPKRFPRHNIKAWDEAVQDTMEMWTGKPARPGQKDSFVSQDTLSKLRGGPGKGDMDGSKVLDLVIEGAFDKVKAYQVEDVAQCRDNYKWMLQTDKLEDWRSITTRPVAPSRPSRKVETPITDADVPYGASRT